MTFFVDLPKLTKQANNILLLDVSKTTLNVFPDGRKKLVYQVEIEIIHNIFSSLGVKKTNVIFYNSSSKFRDDEHPMKKGFSVYPDQINIESFQFLEEKTKDYLSTDGNKSTPSTALNNIPKKMLSALDTCIWIVGCGDVGFQKNLVSGIRKIKNSHPYININIITVEAKKVDYLSEYNNSAHSNMFKTFQSQHSFELINYFKVYSPEDPNGVEIYSTDTDIPSDYIPWTDKIFSIKDENKFKEYLQDQILIIMGDNPQNKNIFEFTINLTQTVTYILNKTFVTPSTQEKIIDNYASLFSDINIFGINSTEYKTIFKQSLNSYIFTHTNFFSVVASKSKVNLCSYVYQCPITLESTEKTGGWIFKEHRTASNSVCHPKVVLSEVGKKEFYKNNLKCLYCYTKLTGNFLETMKPLVKE